MGNKSYNSQMPHHLMSDAHEWINEIPLVPLPPSEDLGPLFPNRMQMLKEWLIIDRAIVSTSERAGRWARQVSRMVLKLIQSVSGVASLTRIIRKVECFS